MVSRTAKKTKKVRPEAQATPSADTIATRLVRRRSKDRQRLKVDKSVHSISIRKPARDWFIRTTQLLVPYLDDSDEIQKEMGWIDAPIIRLETASGSKELWAVDPSVAAELEESEPAIFKLCSDFFLVPTIERAGGTVFLWPVKQEDGTGRLDDWNASAHRIALQAEENWLRVTAGSGRYDSYLSSRELSPPNWPEGLQDEHDKLLQLAFQGKFIDSLDHPMLRKLRGEE